MTLASVLLFAACAGGNKAALEEYRAAEELVAQHLATFDDLDFNVFTNQEWDERIEELPRL